MVGRPLRHSVHNMYVCTFRCFCVRLVREGAGRGDNGSLRPFLPSACCVCTAPMRAFEREYESQRRRRVCIVCNSRGCHRRQSASTATSVVPRLLQAATREREEPQFSLGVFKCTYVYEQAATKPFLKNFLGFLWASRLPSTLHEGYNTPALCRYYLHLKPKFFGQALVLPRYPLRLPAQAAVRLDFGLPPNILNHAL